MDESDTLQNRSSDAEIENSDDLSKVSLISFY